MEVGSPAAGEHSGPRAATAQVMHATSPASWQATMGGGTSWQVMLNFSRERFDFDQTWKKTTFKYISIFSIVNNVFR